MIKLRTYHRKKLLFVSVALILVSILLIGRLFYLMVLKSEDYAKRAKDLHERERVIKAARGIIYDRNGIVLASNVSVCTISVIHAQIKEPERVIKELSERLGLSEETVRKRVEKNSSIERVKTNVPKETADEIRNLKLAGVMVDEDYKRYYPYETLASRVIGFTGSDNQGIIGLEVEYDDWLMGSDGRILTLATAHGVEIPDAAESRIEPVAGLDLYLSLDYNIQSYVTQAAEKVRAAKNAKSVSLIVMNPQNGEIYAMANVPEFNLNEPYILTEAILQKAEETMGDTRSLDEKQTMELLNTMWRNPCISDTYEPGSAFKVVTATAALEAGVVHMNDRFYCPGYKIVEDRRIRCHKTVGHGSESFTQGIQNSCNPVFMEIGERVGVTRLYETFRQVGLFGRTGVDVPGEASSIMHKAENVGPVELATISFGQSFQITPLQLLRAVSAVVNGGTLVTPHFGVSVKNAAGDTIKTLTYEEIPDAVSKETSEQMKMLLESVVAEGTGSQAYLAGFHVGGKTATSEKLPRRSGKYIASFVGFAPADNPQVAAIVLIDEPQGIYYGGTIAAPVIREVFADILPYLGIEETYTEAEQKEYRTETFPVPDVVGLSVAETKKLLKSYAFGEIHYLGEGENIAEQFPLAGEEVKQDSDFILYLK